MDDLKFDWLMMMSLGGAVVSSYLYLLFVSRIY